jgi:hypothetical protein
MLSVLERDKGEGTSVGLRCGEVSMCGRYECTITHRFAQAVAAEWCQMGERGDVQRTRAG